MQILGNLVTEHSDWVTAAAFVTAFLESCVVASFLIPGTTILLGIGLIVAATSLPIEPVLAAGSLGAIAGNAVSSWLGRHFRSRLDKLWPLRSNPFWQLTPTLSSMITASGRHCFPASWHL